MRAPAFSRALPAGGARRLAAALPLAVLLAAAAPAHAQAPTDVPPAEAGRRIYAVNCARCHGLNMVSTGSGSADLRRFPLEQKDRFVQAVTQGLRAMPAWGNTLKPEEIELLWAYVSSAAR